MLGKAAKVFVPELYNLSPMCYRASVEQGGHDALLQNRVPMVKAAGRSG